MRRRMKMKKKILALLLALAMALSLMACTGGTPDPTKAPEIGRAHV